MNIYKSQIYLDDLRCAIKNSVDIEHLFNASIMITGATGLIGSFIVDVLLLCNKELNQMLLSMHWVEVNNDSKIDFIVQKQISSFWLNMM